MFYSHKIFLPDLVGTVVGIATVFQWTLGNTNGPWVGNSLEIPKTLVLGCVSLASDRECVNRETYRLILFSIIELAEFSRPKSDSQLLGCGWCSRTFWLVFYSWQYEFSTCQFPGGHPICQPSWGAKFCLLARRAEFCESRQRSRHTQKASGRVHWSHYTRQQVFCYPRKFQHILQCGQIGYDKVRLISRNLLHIKLFLRWFRMRRNVVSFAKHT